MLYGVRVKCLLLLNSSSSGSNKHLRINGYTLPPANKTGMHWCHVHTDRRTPRILLVTGFDLGPKKKGHGEVSCASGTANEPSRKEVALDGTATTTATTTEYYYYYYY